MLGTVGSSTQTFYSPTAEALASIIAALRLCAWEKSRLEEIYTAHLLRLTHDNGESCPTLHPSNLQTNRFCQRVSMLVDTSHRL